MGGYGRQSALAAAEGRTDVAPPMTSQIRIGAPQRDRQNAFLTIVRSRDDAEGLKGHIRSGSGTRASAKLRCLVAALCRHQNAVSMGIWSSLIDAILLMRSAPLGCKGMTMD